MTFEKLKTKSIIVDGQANQSPPQAQKFKAFFAPDTAVKLARSKCLTSYKRNDSDSGYHKHALYLKVLYMNMKRKERFE